MKTLRARTVDRVVHSLFACVLVLAVLFLWHRLHERSCLAIVFPALIWLTIFNGLLQSRLERKRFVVDYYLDRRSFLHRRLQRIWLSVLISLSAAGLLAAFLVVFVARSRPTDWYFLWAATTIAPLLFNALSTWPGSHFRRDSRDARRRARVADVLVVRLAGTLLLSGLAVVYVYVNYYLVPVPPGVDPDSLERTLEALTVSAQVACPLVENVLLIATQVEGLSWYFVTTAATSQWLHDGVGSVLWVAFSLNAAMVFGGFVRGLEGSSCSRGGRWHGIDRSDACLPKTVTRAGRTMVLSRPIEHRRSARTGRRARLTPVWTGRP